MYVYNYVCVFMCVCVCERNRVCVCVYVYSIHLLRGMCIILVTIEERPTCLERD